MTNARCCTALGSLIIVLATLGGCKDQTVLAPSLTEACRSPLACQVSGVDLVVDSPVVLVDTHARDPNTGQIILQPLDSFRVVARVWNRGDRPSDTTSMHVWTSDIAIPSLQPGEAFVDTVGGKAPVTTGWGLSLDENTVEARLLHTDAAEDPIYANNANQSRSVLFSLPVLTASITSPDSVVVGTPFVMTVKLTNESAHGRMDAMKMGICMFVHGNGRGCGALDIGSALLVVDAPSLAPGESWTTSLTVTPQEIISPWGDKPDWDLAACMSDASAAFSVNWSFCRYRDTPVTLLKGSAD